MLIELSFIPVHWIEWCSEASNLEYQRSAIIIWFETDSVKTLLNIKTEQNMIERYVLIKMINLSMGFVLFCGWKGPFIARWPQKRFHTPLFSLCMFLFSFPFFWVFIVLIIYKCPLFPLPFFSCSNYWTHNN